MDLLDWVGTLLRRWWLTLPLLLAALLAAGAIAVVTPWKYEAKATAVLLASSVQAKGAGGNPWLVFDSSLTVTAEVLGREMMDQRTAAALQAKGLTATYVVGVAPDSTGPVLAIDVSGTDAAGVKATLDALLAQVPQRLARLQSQESVSPNAQIKMNVISASPKAALVATDKIRTVVMVLFLGIVVAIAVPLFAEVLAERRRRGRESAAAPRDPASGPRRPGTTDTEAPRDEEPRDEAEPRPRDRPRPRPRPLKATPETTAKPEDTAKPGNTTTPKDAVKSEDSAMRAPDTPESYGLLTYQPPERPSAAPAGANGSAPPEAEPAETSEPDA
ncbi:hypothetical protein [Actinomadura roseirufa]|uniref:hypothetical protein n=1 Tax=Actinomadura roseirufa TaxID=2094049 RepID=UPI0010411EF9|nr:hypothetical protein [Actinomadura roseirufa]